MSADAIPPRAKPRAFRLDETNVLADNASSLRAGDAIIAQQPDAFAPVVIDEETNAEQATEVAQRRGILSRTLMSWSGIFWSALSALFSLALGLWVTRIIDDLFTRSAALGWIGAALAGVVVLAALVMLTREVRAVLRQRRIAEIHTALAHAREADDRDAARVLLATLTALYASRPDTAQARALVDDLSREIVDGRDLIDIAERNLMTPLDEQARRAIALAAKRVSVVTAISPRAIVDVIFVGAQAIRLIRGIAGNLWRAARPARFHQAGALGWRASRHHWRHGGG